MLDKEEKLLQEVDVFLEQFIEKMESIPDNLDHVRLYFANQVICQATIWGARNVFEGIGMLETAKLEYLEIHKEIEQQEQEAVKDLESKLYISKPKKGDLLN